tara:strand:- start:1827 stop:2069 length:243 start_codon:yes stop_codon:yes gene_type:complete
LGEIKLKSEKCWVWFKGGIDEGGKWEPGFTCTFDESIEVLVENSTFVPCRLPKWRISTKEPIDLKAPPEIPENNKWKFNK